MTPIQVKNYQGLPRNRVEILAFSGIPPRKSQEEELSSSLQELQECLKLLPETVEGKICYTILPAEGFSPESKALAAHLKDATHLCLFAATVGIDYDRKIQRYSHLSPVKAVFLQAIGASAVETLCDAFCEDLKKQYPYTTTRFSPGYGDLPLSAQLLWFQILHPEKHIGLSLSESLLMTPTKSVTAVVGLKHKE